MTREPARIELSELWARAAIVGGFWGGLEIIMGSSLHNLRLPFAGTALAAFAVCLLTAFHRCWPERGLIWRAGLICAALKSVSPSAVLIGPMVGIVLEAVMLEFGLRLAGMRLIGYILGGSMALAAGLLQKCLRLLLFYGTDIVGLASNLYQFVAKQCGINGAQPQYALLTLLLVYAVAGTVAAALGFWLGSKASRRITEQGDTMRPDIIHAMGLPYTKAPEPSAFWFPLAHLAVIMVGLMALRQSLLFPALGIAVYVGFCALRYKNGMVQLQRPLVWVQAVIIMLLGTLFWRGEQGSQATWLLEGLAVGSRMNLRALLVLVGFLAISIEMRNPRITEFMMANRMFGRLYVALDLTFSALPCMMADLRGIAIWRRSPVGAMATLMAHADHYFHTFQGANTGCSRIIVITGPTHLGKSAFAKEVFRSLQRDGYSVGGIMAEACLSSMSERSYDVVDIATNTSQPLCSSEGSPLLPSCGRFRFDPVGIRFGRSALARAVTDSFDIVVIDEIGQFELKGEGWRSSIDALVRSNQPMLWVVRDRLCERVLEHWRIVDADVYDITKDTVADVVRGCERLVSPFLVHRNGPVLPRDSR